MYSLLIAICTILISVFITRKLAACLGLAVGLKSLYICAICALSVAIVFPFLPAMLSQYNLLFMLCIALGAAGFITHYNEKLVLANAHDDDAASVLEKPHVPLCATVEAEEQAQAAMPSAKLRKLSKHLRRKHLPSPDAVAATSLVTESISEHLSQPSSDDAPIDAPVMENHEDDHIVPVASIEPSSVVLLPVVAEPIDELSEITAKRNFKKLGRTLKNNASVMVTPQPDLSAFTTLDAILDYSEQQKQQNCYEKAIMALKQALVLYKNDEYAPFIVIELGNFYKNTGLYDEAIVIYSRAYSLPSVINNNNLQCEFEKNITYLRIVKTILCKHNCSQMNFADIPADIMQEIEDSFTLWRSQKHVS